MATTLTGSGISFSDGTSETTAGTSSKSGNGYVKLPSGVIIQWGTTVSFARGSTTVTFPLAFPSACTTVLICPVFASSADFWGNSVSGLGTTSFVAWNHYGTMPNYWIAAGY